MPDPTIKFGWHSVPVDPDLWPGLVSGLSNVLMLTGPLYMLQVYDRVLRSRNISTLVGLSVLALMLFGFQALTDLVRSRVMVRITRKTFARSEFFSI